MELSYEEDNESSLWWGISLKVKKGWKYLQRQKVIPKHLLTTFNMLILGETLQMATHYGLNQMIHIIYSRNNTAKSDWM